MKLIIEINAPFNKVVDMFIDVSKFSKWQDGFQSHQILNGNYLEKGTKSVIVYINRNNKIELTETILSNNLPNELKALYEHKHIDNTTTSKFYQIDKNRTRLEYSVEIIQIKGLILKIMSVLFPKMFSKQTQKWLDNFKNMVETNN